MSVQDPQQGWTALADGGVHVLVGWVRRHPGWSEVRAAAAGGLDEVLDALTVDGVRRAPDFVAVEEGRPCAWWPGAVRMPCCPVPAWSRSSAPRAAVRGWTTTPPTAPPPWTCAPGGRCAA